MDQSLCARDPQDEELAVAQAPLERRFMKQVVGMLPLTEIPQCCSAKFLTLPGG